MRPNYVITPPTSADFGPRLEKNIAIVGRLIEMKGVHIAISAMASDALKEWTLHVIGDGPVREKLQNQAKSLGVADRVLFHGQLPRDTVLRHLAEVRCSLLLSTHDAAGWSAAESISVGTPVHTWNHGGPAEIVSLTGCGTTTPPSSEGVHELAMAIAGSPPCPSDADLSPYYLENLTLELRNWYDEAIR
ncbi:glycosyltransferase [Arthrobacter sp. NPDC080031]|uniref:glycosyltransferase n=1 Tax=Arthrobacter sp. NPDC080031 TaxID=3155918 RepID=UPI00344C4627